MGAFVISKRENGEYKFVYTNRRGNTTLTSAKYATKVECEEDIETIKANTEYCYYVRFKASNGKFFFRIILNGQVLATSRKFNTELRIAKGIDEIKLYASKAETLDFSENDFFFTEEEQEEKVA
ncbi:YegP family protein [Flavobacterium sp. '19STA2R22 D10 B1']|uniref:YegP family protein n=1 Tax=Flavobacterium aerium TaxID=3037261 RepID=UPI00278BE08B|nr:YegP family protein [Flavobacterium sp. '19STA2R22 D10 B1']